MEATNKKGIALIACLVSMTLLAGCTNWKKKYKALDVQYKNCEGRLAFEKEKKGQLEEQVLQGQQTIAELQRQIEERNQTVGEGTGFGDGYDVKLDPSAGTITVTLPNTILFSPGKAKLKKVTSTDLDHIHSVLQSKYGGREIDVVGHTDSDPIKKSPWKDNWELSAERALSVVRYLIKRGISGDRIRAVACGESRPVAPNATASGKAKNRRVEIVVHMR